MIIAYTGSRLKVSIKVKAETLDANCTIMRYKRTVKIVANKNRYIRSFASKYIDEVPHNKR